MGLGSRVATCAIALATLQPCPHVRVSLQYAVLRKKVHEVHKRYLASEVRADVLAWLGCQQRSWSASEFYEIELSSTWWNWLWKKYT